MRLERSKVLLTGASGGIGKAIARALHARGAELLVTARREDVLEELRSELGGRVQPLTCDLAQRDAVAGLAEAAGDVDVLVANAALPASGPIDDFTPEEIDRALDVNLRAPIQLASALTPGMVRRGRGHVVLVSSLSGKVASTGSGLYSAAKFGLRGFGAALRQDLHGTGVGVTVVYPGFIRDAGMFAEADVELRKGVGTSTPEEVAEAVVRGVERDRPEIDVAPLAMRAGTLIASIAPVTMARVQRRLGGGDVAEQMRVGQRDKR
jgi:short-subunit dehydrogenase